MLTLLQGMQKGQGSRGVESSLSGEMSSVTFLAELAEFEPRANQRIARDVNLQRRQFIHSPKHTRVLGLYTANLLDTYSSKERAHVRLKLSSQ